MPILSCVHEALQKKGAELGSQLRDAPTVNPEDREDRLKLLHFANGYRQAVQDIFGKDGFDAFTEGSRQPHKFGFPTRPPG